MMVGLNATLPGRSPRGFSFAPAPLAAYGIGGDGASTWVFDFNILATTGFNQIIWRLDDGTANNGFDLFFTNATNGYALRRSTAGVLAGVALITAAYGIRYGCAVTVRGDGTARAKVDGLPAAEIAGGPVAGLIAGRWGSLAGGGLLANAAFKNNIILRGSVDNAALDILAGRAAAW